MFEEMPKWQSVRFRLFGLGLHVEEVELLLGLKPTVSARAGEIVGGSLMQRTNEWIWEYPEEEGLSFVGRVQKTLELLETKRNVLSELLAKPEVIGEFVIECSPGCDDGVASLFPDSLDRITGLGLTLALDLYRVVESEEE